LLPCPSKKESCGFERRQRGLISFLVPWVLITLSFSSFIRINWAFFHILDLGLFFSFLVSSSLVSFLIRLVLFCWTCVIWLWLLFDWAIVVRLTFLLTCCSVWAFFFSSFFRLSFYSIVEQNDGASKNVNRITKICFFLRCLYLEK
jgi:hypothetical protein